MQKISVRRRRHCLRARRKGFRVTTREAEVLKLITQAHNDESIANQLEVSFQTVKSHVRSLFDKFGCNNRTELAVMTLNKQHAEKISQLEEALRRLSKRLGDDTMNLSVKMELSDNAIQDWSDVRRAIQSALAISTYGNKAPEPHQSGNITDVHGKIVGTWEVLQPSWLLARTTPHKYSDPSNNGYCFECGLTEDHNEADHTQSQGG
jgi:DNA-binding CsgD family transcriptional regulator